MTERSVPVRNPPFTDSVDDGAAHAAATDLDLIQGTNALARRSAGNRFSICYHSPLWDTESYNITHAPYADLSDSTTWTSFSTGEQQAVQATFQIPWLVSEGHDYPVVGLHLVSDSRYVSFEVRVQKATFIQATSTQEFYAAKSHMPFFGETMSEWRSADWERGFPAIFHPWVECVGISLPASPRDVLLTPQVKISQRGTSSIVDVGGTHRVYVASVHAYDDWDQ